MDIAATAITGDNFGINVHSTYPAYKDRLPALAARLNELRVGWIRDNNPAGAALWRNAGYTGKILITLSNPADVERCIATNPDAIDVYNEIPWPPDTLAQAKAKAADIVTRVAGRVPCIASSIANINGTKAAALGYQPFARRANCHCYRGMEDEATYRKRQEESVRRAGEAAPGKPTWATETGYHQYEVPGKPATYKGPENANHRFTSEADAVRQVAGDCLAFFRAGVEVVFFYELVDQEAYRAKDGTGDHEGYFGFLRNDLSWKPHALIVRDWIAKAPRPDVELAAAKAMLDTAGQLVRELADTLA